MFTKKFWVFSLVLMSVAPSAWADDKKTGFDAHASGTSHKAAGAYSDHGGTVDFGVSANVPVDGVQLNVGIEGSFNGDGGRESGNVPRLAMKTAIVDEGNAVTFVTRRKAAFQSLGGGVERDAFLGKTARFAVAYKLGQIKTETSPASGMMIKKETLSYGGEAGISAMFDTIRPVANVLGHVNLDSCGAITDSEKQLICFEGGVDLSLGTQIALDLHAGGSYRVALPGAGAKQPSYVYAGLGVRGRGYADSFNISNFASDTQVGLTVGIAR